MTSPLAAGLVAAATMAGVLFRPFRLPEYAFALAGAAAILSLRLLDPGEAHAAVGRGREVYLFLIGMLLLAEAARVGGLFDWTAGHAARAARGSAKKLFALVYGVGVPVTVFLSNDATIVVLTPAVYAAARAARADPLPHLFACAFVANAASFVLPISNPANLVLFGDAMPSLAAWLKYFAAPSLAAVGTTFLVLGWTQRRILSRPIRADVEIAPLTAAGKAAGAALAVSAVVLTATSALGRDLGAPTLVCGLAAALAVALAGRVSPLAFRVSWGVLPLVAGLFVVVAALSRAGIVEWLAGPLARLDGEAQGPALAGAAAGLATNLFNNLPLGLLAASTAKAASASPQMIVGLTIGVDLGPNLSVAGSLASLLWLLILRREGVHVGALDFLKIGALVMPPALIAALAALWLAA